VNIITITVTAVLYLVLNSFNAMILKIYYILSVLNVVLYGFILSVCNYNYLNFVYALTFKFSAINDELITMFIKIQLNLLTC